MYHYTWEKAFKQTPLKYYYHHHMDMNDNSNHADFCQIKLTFCQMIKKDEKLMLANIS